MYNELGLNIYSLMKILKVLVFCCHNYENPIVFTQEEYTTAVYKTVELDAVLDNQAVQHREVEQYESCLFKSYFSCFR